MAPQQARGRAQLAGYAWAAAIIGVTTAGGALTQGWFGAEELVMLYLLAIMLVALRSRRGPAVFASALSVAAFDFFFVPPTFTLAVKDPRQLLTFAVMFSVGLVISSLALRVRKQEEASRVREQRTQLLYDLGRDLAACHDENAVGRVACRRLASALEAEVWAFARGTESAPVQTAREAASDAGSAQVAAVTAAFEQLRTAGLDSDTLAEPLLADDALYGAVVVTRADRQPLASDQRSLLETVGRQLANALDRQRLAREAARAALRARTEELRSALLSAVSHDLRTPLAAITGAATALRDEGAARLATGERRELLESICDEAERLENLLVNLLDMTRLESGGPQLKKEWVPLEEIVGAALTRLDKRLQHRSVQVTIADGASVAFIDPVLFAQVLVNLLENAIKYTPADGPIEIRATQRDDRVEMVIEDRGPGLSPGTEATLFDKFVRGHHPGIGGVGLGLAICRGIVEAHGGRIAAANRSGGGACFRIELPQPDTVPSVPDAIEPPAREAVS